MTFDEVRFPTDISYGSEGGPEFSTEVVEIGNGYERRTQNWTMDRARWNVAYGITTKEKLDTLIAFFRARAGRARGFRFKDHDDYEAEHQYLVRITDTTWQISKAYGSTVKSIKKPVDNATMHIYRASGTEYLSGFTVDYTTGIVTFTSEPTGTPYANFEFDLPCRFDQDYLPRRLDSYEVRSASVVIVEYKL